MKIVPSRLPNRIRVYIQEIESGKTKKDKDGTLTKRSKTYQFQDITFDEYCKRFEAWINTQTK